MLQAQDVHVVVRGDVAGRQRRHAQERVAHATRHLRQPVLFARVTLMLAADPAREHPAVVGATLDVNGHAVRAATSAASIDEAISRVHERLHRQLRRLNGRPRARRRHGE